MRMKFLRIFPETCASTWCLFSSSTRNIAFGSGSITVAITSMDSSFGFPESLFFFSSSCFAISSCPAPELLPGRAGHVLRPGQDPRPVRGHCDGVLEVRRGTAVGGLRHPFVPHAHLVASGVDHRLHRDDHALLQP